MLARMTLVRDMDRDLWFVHPIRSVGASGVWNVIAGGDVVVVAAEPSTAAGSMATSALLEKSSQQRDRQAPIPFEKFDRVRLVASWFRQRPEERQKVLSPEDAIARCRTRARS